MTFDPTPRERVLDAVETALGGITFANGYRSDVQAVAREIKEATELAAFPWICFWPARETPEHQPGREVRVLLELNIYAHVQGSNAQDVSVSISNLRRDVIYALERDQTLGGAATSVMLTDGDSSEGDGKAGSKGFLGSYWMSWQVTYFENSGGH